MEQIHYHLNLLLSSNIFMTADDESKLFLCKFTLTRTLELQEEERQFALYNQHICKFMNLKKEFYIHKHVNQPPGKIIRLVILI